MKVLAEGFGKSSQADEQIDVVLTRFSKMHKGSITRIAQQLNKRRGDGGLAQRLLEGHAAFRGWQIAMMNEAMQKQGLLLYFFSLFCLVKLFFVLDILYVLREIKVEGDIIDLDEIKEQYQNFEKRYDSLYQANLAKMDCSSIINDIIQITEKLRRKFPMNSDGKALNWPKELVAEVPVLLAYLFAVWTISSSQHYLTAGDEAQLVRPHAGQVVAIFRLLGIGHEEKKQGLASLIGFVHFVL